MPDAQLAKVHWCFARETVCLFEDLTLDAQGKPRLPSCSQAFNPWCEGRVAAPHK